MSRLQKAGALHFLLMVEPSPANLPFAFVYNSTDAELAAYDRFATDIKGNLTALVADEARSSLTIVDLDSLFNYVEVNPAGFGIDPRYVDPPTACLQGSYAGTGPRSLCDDAQRHLWFDIVRDPLAYRKNTQADGRRSTTRARSGIVSSRRLLSAPSGTRSRPSEVTLYPSVHS